MPKKIYDSMIYSKMSPERKKKISRDAAKYTAENYVPFSVKFRHENYKLISDYIDYCINNKKCKSKNDFMTNAIKYAIDNDFMGIDGKMCVDDANGEMENNDNGK